MLNCLIPFKERGQWYFFFSYIFFSEGSIVVEMLIKSIYKYNWNLQTISNNLPIREVQIEMKSRRIGVLGFVMNISNRIVSAHVTNIDVYSQICKTFSADNKIIMARIKYAYLKSKEKQHKVRQKWKGLGRKGNGEWEALLLNEENWSMSKNGEREMTKGEKKPLEKPCKKKPRNDGMKRLNMKRCSFVKMSIYYKYTCHNHMKGVYYIY